MARKRKPTRERPTAAPPPARERVLPLLYSRLAQRDLDAVSRDAKLLERLKAAILDLATTPRPPGSIKLQGNADPMGENRRVRVGDYRIIYDVRADAVVIQRVANRREAYD
jgi:mRNA-degrading endonuclease RelE of RelBE toxin-antitoxin system